MHKFKDLITATQAMVQKESIKYTQQIEELVLINQLINQIYNENDTLARAIFGLQTVHAKEEGQKEKIFRTKFEQRRKEKTKVSKPSRSYVV